MAHKFSAPLSCNNVFAKYLFCKTYRTRANKGRFILEAATLRIHAKTHFYAFFM